MPRHLISDAHEWINEIPTVPINVPAKRLPRERSWIGKGGERRPCWAWLYTGIAKWFEGCSIGGRTCPTLKYRRPQHYFAQLMIEKMFGPKPLFGGNSPRTAWRNLQISFWNEAFWCDSKESIVFSFHYEGRPRWWEGLGEGVVSTRQRCRVLVRLLFPRPKPTSSGTTLVSFLLRVR